MDTNSERFMELGWALQDISIDLKTAVDVYFLLREGSPVDVHHKRLSLKMPIYYTHPTDTQKMSLNRFILLPIVVALSKLLELSSFYGAQINSLPKASAANFISAIKEINKKDVRQFRNAYAAHPLKKDNGNARPLTQREGIDAISKILKAKPSGNVFHADAMRRFLRSIYYEHNKSSLVNSIYTVIQAIEKEVGGLKSRH